MHRLHALVHRLALPPVVEGTGSTRGHAWLGSCALLALALGGCSSPPGPPRIDNLPMYGAPAIPRPSLLKQADATFVANAAAGFGGDRQLASIAWTAQADRFLADRNFDFAMRRYNQAWLLDPANYEVYWGFARVLVETDKFNEAIIHLKKALEICGDATQRPALLSDLGAAYSHKADAISPSLATARTAAFVLANAAFTESTVAAPDNGNAWRRWAISLAAEGNYADAVLKARRARELGAPPLPAATLSLIEAHAGKIGS